MGSETSPKLPVFDFTNLNANSPNWESVKSQVHKALVEYGCFEATFDNVALDLRKAILAALEELFDLPLQTKQLNVSNKLFHGYVGQRSGLPLYESMGLDDANISDKVESMTNILWSDGNPCFSKTIHSFSEQLSELDQIIRKMILESLGVEKYLEEHMNSNNYLLRVMRYEGPQTSDPKIGLPTHTDQNIEHIVPKSGGGFRAANQRWKMDKPQAFPTQFRSFYWRRYIINLDVATDHIAAWSNGRLHPPFHRVMLSGNETRYSIGLFSIPKEGYIIKVPEELVDEEHPLLFKPFEHHEFLKYRYSEKGKRDPFAIRTFSGV